MAHPVVTCEVCNGQYSKGNIATHRRTHGLTSEPTGLREWCTSCKKYLAYGQRKRHYAEHRPSATPPPRDQAIVFDPKTGQFKNFRSYGPKSKQYQSPPTALPPPDQLHPNVAPDTPPTSGSMPPMPPSSLPFRVPLSTSTFAPSTSPQVPTSPPTPPSPSPAPSIVEIYEARVKRRLLEVRAALLQQLQKSQESPIETREKIDLPEFCKLVDRAVIGQAISADEYRQLYATGGFDKKQNRYAYVVCTMDDARALLELGLPRRPFVVPSTPSSMTLPLDGPGGFLSELRTKGTIEYHDFERHRDLGPNPITEDADIVVTAFRDPAGRKLNLLNLRNSRHTLPPCFAGLLAYDILTTLDSMEGAGKLSTNVVRDLSNSAHFLICSTFGSYSDTHRDRYGFVTTGHMLAGSKAWFPFPSLDEEELAAWADLGPQAAPTLDPFFLPLDEGDLYIQPPEVPHAVWSPTDCLMAGTMHWHTPSMHIHMAAANHDLMFPDTTNEDAAAEGLTKFSWVAKAMHARNERWPWPLPEEQTLFFKELQVSTIRPLAEFVGETQSLTMAIQKHHRMFPKRLALAKCACKDGCKDTSTCPCLQMGLVCGEGCHKAARTPGQKRRKSGRAVVKTCCDNRYFLGPTE